MPTTTYCEFSVYGKDLEPEDVTRLLGIQPDITWRRGDPRGSHATAFYDNGCWTIRTASSEEEDLNEHLRSLMQRIGSMKEPLGMLAAKYHLEFGCVIFLDEFAPSLHIDASVLKAMSDLGAEFDVDLYLFPEAGA